MIVVSFEIPDLPEQRLERRLVDQVAADVVLKLRLPVPSHRARDVALIVRRRVHVHFHQPDLRIAQVLAPPIPSKPALPDACNQPFHLSCRLRLLVVILSGVKNLFSPFPPVILSVGPALFLRPGLPGRTGQKRRISLHVFSSPSRLLHNPKTKNPPASFVSGGGFVIPGLDSVLAFQPPRAKGRARTSAAATTATAAIAAARSALAAVRHRRKAYTCFPPMAMGCHPAPCSSPLQRRGFSPRAGLEGPSA